MSTDLKTHLFYRKTINSKEKFALTAACFPVNVKCSAYYKINCIKFFFRGEGEQGSIKVLSGSSGEVDFLSGQVTIKGHSPNGQGCRQVIL